MSKKKSNKIFAIIAVLAIVFVIAGYGIYKERADLNALYEKCNQMENDPNLMFECNCVPSFLLNKTDSEEYVKKRSKEMCTCSCDIGTDEPWIVELRVSK